MKQDYTAGERARFQALEAAVKAMHAAAIAEADGLPWVHLTCHEGHRLYRHAIFEVRQAARLQTVRGRGKRLDALCAKYGVTVP